MRNGADVVEVVGILITALECGRLGMVVVVVVKGRWKE